MKLLNRTDFLKMPAGTVFCEGEKWCFQGLMFKGETCPSGYDWYERDPAWIESKDSEESFSRLEDMMENGSSYPMESAEGRNGMYEDDSIFLVFEKADLLKLRDLIDGALVVSGQ